MRRIIVPGPEEFHSAETAELREKAAEAAEYVADLRKGIEADEAARRETDLAEFDAGEPTNAARLNKVDLLQAELKVCRLLEPFFKAQSAESGAENTRLHQEMETARQEIEEGLQSIGYAKPLKSERVVGSYLPGWVNQHPRIVRAHHESRRLSGFGKDHAELNRKNTAEIEAQLKAIRDAAVT